MDPSLKAELQKLQDIFEMGFIMDEEYLSRKQEILQRAGKRKNFNNRFIFFLFNFSMQEYLKKMLFLQIRMKKVIGTIKFKMLKEMLYKLLNLHVNLVIGIDN